MNDILERYLRYSNCKFFKGDVPCKEHKLKGKRCPCESYTPIDKKILIIKLGAAGDVIRTTPILYPLKKHYSNSYIVWISYYPELLPSLIDEPLGFSLQSILRILAEEFDILINLDKDKEALSLTNLVKAKTKKGFFLKDGKCMPINKEAYHKFLTGIDDKVSRENSFSYLEEIFHICGFSYNKEPYILEVENFPLKLKNLKRPVIGLNTGCGERWPTRLWPEDYWVQLAGVLQKKGYSVVILGGPQEDEKNKRIAHNSGALYLGYFPLKEFISLVNECDCIITQVSLAFHIAIGLKKKVILMNNVFNRNEFELYGCGKIIEPPVDCLGCYKNFCEKKCMELISVEDVIREVENFCSLKVNERV